MNVPSPGPFDTGEHRRPSPADSPYTNARSPSGHLIPYSPAPARRYSQNDIPWMIGSQTSLHNEPSSLDRDGPQVVSDPIPESSSSPTLHTHHGSHTPNSDMVTHPSHPSSPRHRTISFASEMSFGNPEAKSSPRTAHIHFDTNRSEPHRSRTPLSVKSSQLSISHRSLKSCNSQNSIGRASYREHHGPPAHVRTPAHQDAPVFGPPSSPTIGRAKPSDSVPFENYIAPPSVDDPNRPGSPIHIGNRFYPMSAKGVLRYENRNIRCQSKDNYQIEAMTYQYPETQDTPEGWIGYRHPEGALYFVHGESKTFTEVNICNDQIYEDIEYFREYLFSELKSEIRRRNLSESLKVDEVQLVLEPKVDEKGVMCCYYFVNPRTRSLFWLDEWEAFEIFKDCTGILSSPHKGLAVQAEYWYATKHWDLYPNFCKVTRELKDEVADMIVHATCDYLTSNKSTCPLNTEELKNHLSLIDRIDPEKAGKRGHSAIVIGRIMHIFYNNNFLNFYGEDCARLNFDQTVHGWRYHPSPLMTVFAPLLFMAPVHNVRLLHRIFVDDIASKEKWNMFVTKLNSQLQETSVLATVLLNANVGFLPKESGTGTSPQQILSYMSIVATMASIILGLVFMGHSRTEARNTPFEAAKFLHGLRHERHGLETLAIVYSLPHALLMWAMVFFFAAFAVQWCYPGDTVSRASVGGFMVIVAFLVVWCIWVARDRCHFWWFQADPKQKEHMEHEEEEDDSKFPPGMGPGSGFLCGFTSLIPKFIMSTPPHPSESHGTQDIASRHDVPGPPSSIPGPNFWARSHTD